MSKATDTPFTLHDQHETCPAIVTVSMGTSKKKVRLEVEWATPAAASKGYSLSAVLTPEAVRSLVTELQLFADEAECNARRAVNLDVTAMDVLRSLGFEKRNTGGGHTALFFSRPDGEICEVIDGETGQAPDSIEDGWDVRFYRTDEECAYFGTSFPDGKMAAVNLIAEWRVG